VIARHNIYDYACRDRKNCRDQYEYKRPFLRLATFGHLKFLRHYHLLKLLSLAAECCLACHDPQDHIGYHTVLDGMSFAMAGASPEFGPPSWRFLSVPASSGRR
jgi:hypothetical protein